MIKGYIHKIEVCDALNDEMWGMHLGLDLAWRGRILQLIVESDSKFFTNMTTYNCKFSGRFPHWCSVFTIFWLCMMCPISSQMKKGNQCADLQTNFSQSLNSLNYIRMKTLPNKLHRFLFDDIFKVCMSKNIKLIS